MKAILLSGGLDSITLAYWLRPQIAVTIDYGQRPARAELTAAAEVCKALGMQQEVITVDCSALGRGSLVDDRPVLDGPSPEWWPFRNQLLITLALMRLVNSQADELMLGTVAGDELHADGTPTFYASINQLVAAQEYAPRITAPAQAMSTEALVRTSGVPPEILMWSHSCQVSHLACGTCRGCVKRLDVLNALGLMDLQASR
ncbi:7-cyano-7-deazaguanine synthase [Rhizobacter sp. J219]|jgi:7-cyano-7-deazaguanine synthase|uniref:7-cyano-7-deazaguanine synthase n=1 Tax=Piscinibacter gummiphilus TaxID=946333 RepID=A0ABZ0D1C2_9BURK|nr:MULTISPECIES: 7-cyano-7-deazaguanine synthase [Burkholderiales]MCR5882148.1 7-cyano-7-deazaguanine synthase [Rhizobacter sp. J219]WOB10967.1 7-cyano-7-deazaguanine synthase [Piscinibacter gummiphilus]